MTGGCDHERSFGILVGTPIARVATIVASSVFSASRVACGAAPSVATVISCFRRFHSHERNHRVRRFLLVGVNLFTKNLCPADFANPHPWGMFLKHYSSAFRFRICCRCRGFLTRFLDVSLKRHPVCLRLSQPACERCPMWLNVANLQRPRIPAENDVQVNVRTWGSAPLGSRTRRVNKPARRVAAPGTPPFILIRKPIVP